MNTDGRLRAPQMNRYIHWGGEEGYSEERRKEIEDGVKRLRCDRLDTDRGNSTPAVLGSPTVIAGVGVTHLRYPVGKA